MWIVLLTQNEPNVCECEWCCSVRGREEIGGGPTSRGHRASATVVVNKPRWPLDGRLMHPVAGLSTLCGGGSSGWLMQTQKKDQLILFHVRLRKHVWVCLCTPHMHTHARKRSLACTRTCAAGRCGAGNEDITSPDMHDARPNISRTFHHVCLELKAQMKRSQSPMRKSFPRSPAQPSPS